MKRILALFLACAPISGYSAAYVMPALQTGTGALARAATAVAGQCTVPRACTAMLGLAAVSSVSGYQSFFKPMLKREIASMELGAQWDPVPDCPVKRKITQKFADHGYSVTFIKYHCGTTDNAAVCAYGKKVIFFVCYGWKGLSFFNDPELDDARDGIIEHEIAHVLNGDLAQRFMFESARWPFMMACAGIATLKVATSNPSELIASVLKRITPRSSFQVPFTSSLGSFAGTKMHTLGSSVCQAVPYNFQSMGSKIAAQLPKISMSSVLDGCTSGLLGLYAGAITFVTTGVVGQLGSAILSRYHETRADYAALKLKDPKVLDGMASFFDRLGQYRPKNMTWKQWVIFKMFASHPCCRDRSCYLRKEAAKMRKKQAQGA